MPYPNITPPPLSSLPPPPPLPITQIPVVEPSVESGTVVVGLEGSPFRRDRARKEEREEEAKAALVLKPPVGFPAPGVLVAPRKQGRARAVSQNCWECARRGCDRLYSPFQLDLGTQ